MSDATNTPQIKCNTDYFSQPQFYCPRYITSGFFSVTYDSEVATAISRVKADVTHSLKKEKSEDLFCFSIC